jgi:hypothetical protein
MTKVWRTIQEDNPREYDNLGTMVCFHRRYNLGDPPFRRQGLRSKHDITDPDELRKMLATDEYISLPLYLYDHSGITMRTTPFNDPWDSGQVGWIFVSKADVRKEYGVMRITDSVKRQVYKELEAEVKCYDQYITGESEEVDVDDEEQDDVQS